MNFFFTTQWGLIYLIALTVTMVPALFWKKRFMLVTTMVLLWLLDRIAVAFVPAPECLAYLAFAYFAMSVLVAWWHPRQSLHFVIAFLLALTAIPFIFGAWGALDWDTVGSFQEGIGGLSMLLILFWRRHDGHRVPEGRRSPFAFGGNYHSTHSPVASGKKAADRKGHS